MSKFNQKKQKVKNQINAQKVEQEISNTGKLSQRINAKKVNIGTKSITCPKCKSLNKNASRFCKKCGESLTKLCLTCWTENELSTVFCTTCGTDIKKSKFGIPPQLAKAWKEKFASQNWQAPPIDEPTLAILKRMGQPVNKNEMILLTAGITGESLIHKLSVVGKDVLPDPIFKEKHTGSITLTSQRIIVKNRVDGWVASYPHEYLNNLTTNQGSTLKAGYKKAESFTFFLDYKNLGKIVIHKLVPTLIQPRGMIARITSDNSHNAQMDLQTTLINTVLAKRIQESNDENLMFANFFLSIVELQKNYHQNRTNFTSGLSFEKFIQDAPEIKLLPEKDSCAPKAATMLVLVVVLVSLVANILF